MTTLEVLKDARNLIADKGRWCRGYAALAESGHPVRAHSDRAVRWCAVGAVRHIVGDDWDAKSIRSIRQMLNIVSEELHGKENLVLVNDHDGHEAVLKVFDEAIKLLEEGNGPDRVQCEA